MTWASISRALSQRASQKPSRPVSKAMAIRLILCPAFSASARQRSSSFRSSFASAASFFRGWRSTPGMIPATSHVLLLSSTTAVNVRLGSNGISERLRSLRGFGCFFGLRIDGSIGEFTSAADGAIARLIICRSMRFHRRSPHSICTTGDAGQTCNDLRRSLAESLVDERPGNGASRKALLILTPRLAWLGESTFDWLNRQWSVPINFEIAKLVKFGSQPVQFEVGLRYWADNPDTGGARLRREVQRDLSIPHGQIAKGPSINN